MSDDRVVGRWMRQELDKEAMTIRELSRRTDIAERDLYRYLKGQDPSPAKLARIMVAFGYEVPWDITTRVLFDSIVSQSLGSGTYG
jgi:predicted transcriptional regulator